jgi:iron complex outermembrane receptor protein
MIYQLLNPDGTILGPAQGATISQNLNSRAKWDELTPHAAIKYQFDDVLVYGSYTRGYNTGGYSGRAPDVSTAGPYNPETVNAFEVGVKSEWFDKRLRINGALFRNSYKNKQEEVSVATTIPPFFGTSILNVSSARIQGLELEVAAVPVEGLTLNGSLGYLDAKYTNFIADITGQGVTNNNGLKLRRAPEISGSLGMDYTHPVGSGEASGGVRMRYQGDHEVAITNDPNGHVKASAVIDANVAYEMSVDGVDWRLGLYGRNLSDQIVQTTFFRAGGFLAFAAATRGREFGIELKAKF